MLNFRKGEALAPRSPADVLVTGLGANAKGKNERQKALLVRGGRRGTGKHRREDKGRESRLFLRKDEGRRLQQGTTGTDSTRWSGKADVESQFQSQPEMWGQRGRVGQ
jgi:hypothetical protein